MNNEYNPIFAAEHKDHIGNLSFNVANRSGGKKLLEWEFSVPGKSVPVKISVAALSNMTLHATASELPREGISDTDMVKLFNQVEKYLQTNVGDIQNIDWEDWLEVRVEGSKSEFKEVPSFNGWGRDLKIHISKIKRGTHRETGELFSINRNDVLVKFPKSRESSAEAPLHETTMGGIKLDKDHIEVSYIPATQENIDGLRDLMTRMDALRGRLSEMLRQDVIQHSLFQISNVLPALEKKYPDGIPGSKENK